MEYFAGYVDHRGRSSEILLDAPTDSQAAAAARRAVADLKRSFRASTGYRVRSGWYVLWYVRAADGRMVYSRRDSLTRKLEN